MARRFLLAALLLYFEPLKWFRWHHWAIFWGLVYLLASTQVAHAQCTVENRQCATASSSASISVTSYNPHNCTGTSKLVAYAGVVANPDGASSVSWNTSESLTEIAGASIGHAGSGNDPHAALWYLDSPTDTTATVLATWADSTPSIGFLCVWTLCGADTGAPSITAETSGSGSGAPSLSMDINNEACVISAITTDNDGGLSRDTKRRPIRP